MTKPVAIILCAVCLLLPAAVATAAEVHLADDSLLTAGSPPPANHLPVLFVHGHNPTDNDTDFNYKKNWWNPLNGRPSFKEALGLPENAGLDIEPYFIRFQDQDRSITEDAAEIADAVGAILQRHDPTFDPTDPSDTTTVQVVLLAYSKGTISARQYLKSLQTQVPGMPAPRPDFRPVSEFIAISPPNHGIRTSIFATTDSLAVRQLYNGYRPEGIVFDCGDSFGTTAATDYIEILNGHPIEDTLAEPFAAFPDEAPGIRVDGTPPTAGVLYVVLYASGDRDFVGGDGASDDCQGRAVARNLAPGAINIAVPEVDGSLENDVHQNTVHTTEVLCRALYAAVHHRSPEGQICATVGDLPVIPLPARTAAMLTLDVSGSMLAPACPGCASRLDVLKESVELFVQLWSLLGRPGDRLGVTYFRTEIDGFDLGGETLPPLIGNETALIDDVRDQDALPANLTAMGGGLQRSIELLDPAAVDAERRHIILFTDGMQNVNPMVRTLSTTPPQHDIANQPGRPASNVNASTPPTRLDMLPGIIIDTIGVGAGEAFLSLLEDIAEETGGMSKSTVAPNDELRRFFVEELINALRGFSPQLLAYRRGTTGSAGTATESFAVNDGARKLVFKLSWRRGQALSFRVIKNDVDVTAAGRLVAGEFYAIYTVDLSAKEFAGSGGWRLDIAGKPGTAYEAAAIVDEHRLGYNIVLGRPPHRAGDPLELLVRLSVDGSPLSGDVTVDAVIRRPRLAVGTLLAKVGPAAGDPGSIGEPGQPIGERRLLALVRDKEAWRALGPSSELIRLKGDGKGLYRATLATTAVPGVYVAELIIRGNHPKLGPIERTETVTAVVRFAKAVLAASDLRLREHRAAGPYRVLELVLRPSDRAGNLLGPGLASRVSVGLSSGRVVGGAQDLGDGRYLFLLMLPRVPHIKLSLIVADSVIFSGTFEQLRERAKR